MEPEDYMKIGRLFWEQYLKLREQVKSPTSPSYTEILYLRYHANMERLGLELSENSTTCDCPNSYAARHEGNPTGHYVECPAYGTLIPNKNRAK